jgi:hypothetical protein
MASDLRFLGFGIWLIIMHDGVKIEPQLNFILNTVSIMRVPRKMQQGVEETVGRPFII